VGTLTISADAWLAERLHEHGFGKVTERIVRGWREYGLLPGLVRRGLGRGKGFAFDWPLGAEEQARELATILYREQARPNLGMAALSLFVRGFEVRESTLRRAFEAFIQASVRWTGSDAEAAAAKAMRSLRRQGQLRRAKLRTGRRGREAEEALRGALTAIFAAVLGTPIEAREVYEGARVAGLPRLLDDPSLEPPPDVLGRLSLPAFLVALRRSSLADMRRARELALGVETVAETRAGGLGIVSPDKGPARDQLRAVLVLVALCLMPATRKGP